jgi:hypothetical protein
VLCLESELAYRLGTFDIYAAAGFIAEHAHGLKRAAVVCHPDFKADGAFWEDVAVNRGLMVRAFQDQALAEAWVRE